MANSIIRHNNKTVRLIGLVIFILFYITSNISAATITSTGSGNWNSTTANSPWPNGTVPALGDNVIIANGNTVTLTANVAKTAGSTVVVNQGGTLNCNAALSIAASAAVEFTISGNVNISVANGLNRNGASNAAITATGVLSLITTNATVGVQVWDLQTGSTVRLTAAGNQTLDPDFIGTGIDNLILSGSGIKTLGEATTVSQILSIEGAASFANGGNTLTYGAGATLRYLTTDTRTVGAEWITPFIGTGGVIIGNTAGSITMNAAKVLNSAVPLTINTGSTLITNNFQLTIGGNFTNNSGTFTPGTGTVVFNGNSTAINGTSTTQTFNNITVNKTAGQTLSVGGSTTTLNIGGAFTQTSGNFTAPATMSVTGNTTLTTGTFTAPTNLNLNGSFTNNGATFTAGSGTVSMNGSGVSIGGSTSTTFNNLTINNAGGTSLGISATINNLLTLNSGRLSIGANNLIFGTSALAIAGTLNANNMIVATGSGQVRKLANSNGSFLFPIGDIASVAEYSPITVSFSSGTYAGGSYYGVNVTNAKHPNNTTISNFLNRYWSVTQSGITSYIASVTATYLTADIVGIETGQAAARYTGSIWVKYGALGSNTLTASSLTSLGDFTGINNTPVITVAPTSLTTFTYPFNNGPSNILSFNVSGTDLVENVVISPSASFEVSATGGVNFVASPSVSLSPTGGSISSLPVYVRMKAGLALGAVNSQNVVASSLGATSVNVSCSGTVSNQPVITLSPASLTGFSYTFTLGPSAEQTFNVSGVNLYSNVTITAPANYEISTISGAGFTPSTPSISPTSGNIALGTGAFTNVPIYIRLKAGLGTGSFVENVVATATYAANKTVSCTGTVDPKATLTTSTSWLASFIYSGAGPSASQTFQLVGSSLGANNVTVTPPTDFELSINGTTWNQTAFTITPSAGSVNQTIYARLRSGRAVGNYGPQNVTLNAAGAVVKTVALNGSVVNTPTILVSKTTLTGFGYLFGSTISAEQTVSVSGGSLSNNITITPPANFEVLNPSTGTYQSTAITLTRSGTTVNATNISVRLKLGIIAGNYTGNLDVVSTGATAKTVALTGKVFATPLITTTGGGNYCLGETINLTSTGIDVQSRFWTGPGNFYSILNNPTLTNATEAMSGAYTVTGNVIVGGNLIYNGDFESGNTGVGSSYTYVVPGKSLNTNGNLWPESTYTVDTNPQASHNNFPVCPPGPGDPTGNRMIINGAPQAGVVIWSQSVSVIPNSNYEFVYFLQSVRPEAPSQLQLYVNGEMAGPIYSASSTTCIWNKYIYNTNSGSNNLLNLELINMNTVANGNDFALDDISFKQILSATSTQNVVVSPSVVASVTVTHSPTSVYQNTPVVFTANPVNGGATPTYKWFVGGVEQVGQTASTLNYTPTATGALTVTCQMTSSITCASPKPAIGNDNITVQAPIQNYWMGYIDTDWGKPANWTANYIPATGDNVIYATVANFGTAAMRDLQLDINRTIGSLINATIRRLIIPANLTLNCNNVITVTPPVTVPVTNAEDLVYIKASTTLPNGSIIYRNTQSLPAYGTVEMYSPASWDLSRPINQKYNWQFFGIPVTAVDALPTFYGAYVRELIESDNDTSTHWRMLTNTSVLVPFKGYELCQKNANTLYTFKGQLVNSNFESGQFVKTTTGNPLYPGQHLFANPYTAALDINLIDFGNGVEKTAYLYATGTFVQWRTNKLKTDGAIPGQYFAVPRGQAGEFGIPRQVPSMGTLMVRVPKANATTELSYVNFAYNTVAMGNLERQRVKAATIADNQTTTVIDVEGENAADRMWLMSNEGFTRGFDNGFDGIKLKGSALNPQLYAVEKDGEYQVNSVDDLNNTTLAFQAGVDLNYVMTFTHNENSTTKYKKIFLHDLVENQIIEITTSGTKYAFNASSTPNPVLRFKILSQNESIDTEKVSLSKVYHFDNKLYIQNFSENEGKVFVYDISGRMIGIKTISANQNIQIAAPKNNTYIVKVVIGSVSETSKIFLQ